MQGRLVLRRHGGRDDLELVDDHPVPPAPRAMW